MFNIGPLELLVIAIVALVFVGPKQLPELMKQAGKVFVKARRTAAEVRSGFDDVVRQAEEELRLEEAKTLRQSLLAAAAVDSQATPSSSSSSRSGEPVAPPEDPHAIAGAKPFVHPVHGAFSPPPSTVEPEERRTPAVLPSDATTTTTSAPAAPESTPGTARSLSSPQTKEPTP